MVTARTVTATFITKPARKLIIRRGVLSTDYFSFCEEIGCDIWDILEKTPHRADDVSFVMLPAFLTSEGTSGVGCAVEVPCDYHLPVPEGCDIIDLPAQAMLWFQGAPYEDESWYGGAHTELNNAIENYNPELFGYRFAPDLAPKHYFSASAQKGCRALIPVVALRVDTLA